MSKQSRSRTAGTVSGRRIYFLSLICLLFTLFFSGGCPASEQVSFHTDYLRVELTPSGSIESIYDLVHNKQYLAQSQPSGLLSIRDFGYKNYHPTAAVFSENNSLITLSYEQIGVEATIRIVPKKTHITFELVSITPEEKIERIIWGPVPTTINQTIGETVGVVRDDRYAIGIQALNVKTVGGGASGKNFGSTLHLYCRNRSQLRIDSVWGHKNVKIQPIEGYTMAGAKMALFGCPEKIALETIGKIELAEGLPHPMLDGQWAKISPTATAAYMIMPFAESNIDLALKATKKAGLKYLYQGGPFETWGHFKLHSASFPDGYESMARCVEKAKKMGIRLGVHTLTNFITPNDAYVTPIPDKRLARTGSSTITKAIDEKPSVTGHDAIEILQRLFIGAGYDVQDT